MLQNLELGSKSGLRGLDESCSPDGACDGVAGCGGGEPSRDRFQSPRATTALLSRGGEDELVLRMQLAQMEAELQDARINYAALIEVMHAVQFECDDLARKWQLERTARLAEMQTLPADSDLLPNEFVEGTHVDTRLRCILVPVAGGERPRF